MIRRDRNDGWPRKHPLLPGVWTATTPTGDVLRDDATGAPRAFASEADAIDALRARRAEIRAASRRHFATMRP